MRRKDREIIDKNEIFEIISNCPTVCLAMVDENMPYVVALNFGYERIGDKLVMYFHSAHNGKKIDILKKSPNVYFEMDCANEFVDSLPKAPCAYSWNFDSVMGSGKVEFIKGSDQKAYALNKIIKHVGKIDEDFVFPAAALDETCIFRVSSEDFTAKRHKQH